MKVLRIDTGDAGWLTEARAMLGQVNDGDSVSLGTLFGFDLCVLGATGQPIGREALRSAWQGLGQWAQDDFTETSALYLIERGLIKEPLIGRVSRARYRTARYPMSAGLGLLLRARESPAFIIATHQEPRIPPVTYFQLQGINAVVEEITEQADGDGAQDPLAVLHHYRLLSQASAADELVRWALKPAYADRHQPTLPRLISFFGCAEGGIPDACQLAIRSTSEVAQVDGPEGSDYLDEQELTSLLSGLVTVWADTHNPHVDSGPAA